MYHLFYRLLRNNEITVLYNPNRQEIRLHSLNLREIVKVALKGPNKDDLRSDSQMGIKER